MFVYILSFTFGRGALFIAPLVLANFLGASEYGMLETALAAAAIWTSTTSLGTSSAIPLVLLRNNTHATIRGIVFHQFIVVSAAACFLSISLTLKWPIEWNLTALMTSCLLMQGLVSTYLKTNGHSEASLLTDAGLLGIMATASVVAHYLHKPNPLRFAILASITYCSLLIFINLRTLARHKNTRESLAWLATIRTSAPLMLGGMMSLLATTSGRLGMGLLANPELTAIYSILARAGALPIIAHQLILVAKFPNIFKRSDKDIESETIQIILLVSTCVLGFLLLSPSLGFLFGSAFVNSFSQHNLAGRLIAAQAVLWSGIALNDLIITRNQIMYKVLPYSISFLFLALGAGWLTLAWSGVSLLRFVAIHSCIMFSFYIAQCWTMNHLNLRLTRSWMATSILYLLLAIFAFFSHAN